MVRHLPFLFPCRVNIEGMKMPRLETERLILRPPEYSDGSQLVRLAGDYDVAGNLAELPHPFTEAEARAFVTRAHEKRALGEGFCFAILDKESGVLMGCCSLSLSEGRYKLGYWLGKAYWNQGFATEAAKKLISFAFRNLKAETLWASWFDDNPASGHILAKLGFEPVESYLRQRSGRTVICHRTRLSRDSYGKRKAPAARVAAAAAGA